MQSPLFDPYCNSKKQSKEAAILCRNIRKPRLSRIIALGHRSKQKDQSYDRFFDSQNSAISQDGKHTEILTFQFYQHFEMQMLILLTRRQCQTPYFSHTRKNWIKSYFSEETVVVRTQQGCAKDRSVGLCFGQAAGRCINSLHGVSELLQGIGRGLLWFLLERMEQCELKRIIRWIKSWFLSVFFLLSVFTTRALNISWLDSGVVS